MNLDRFERAARSAFSFLERDFGFAFEPDSDEDRREHWWVRELTYRSTEAFVRVELDDRERVFNILLGPLLDGELLPYPSFPERDDDPLPWFPLWAILHARGVIPEPGFSFAEDERLERDLAAWAAALREHAAAALGGDFGDLHEPVRRIKREQLEEADERDRRRFKSPD